MIHISHQHQAVVLPSRPDLLALFPHAVKLQYNGLDMLALPHGIDETRLLRNLQLDVPAPVVEHYKFPHMNPSLRPFDKQVLTTALITMNPRSYVLNKMGTGKTLAAIWAYDYLHGRGLAKKMLVAAPLSTLDFVWAREVRSSLHNVRVQILDGDKERRLKRLRQDADIYIINHDGMEVIEKELLARYDIDTFCIDELAVFRNARADRSKCARRIMEHKRWGWGMTGSPTPTAPTDAFGLAKLMTPERAPRSFTQFRQDTMVQVSQFKWLPRADAAETVARLLQPSVCFTLDDVTELPPLIERELEVEQGVRQKAVYKELVNQAAVLLKEGQVTAANGGIVMNKLLQVSGGYVYMDDGRVASLDNDARLETVLELVQETERKIIVFSPYKHMNAGISAFLTHKKISHATVNGDVSPSERGEIFNLFQNTDKYKVLNAHPACMAHGLTLTAADTIVWFGPIPSLETYEQANARIRRVGQTAKQQVFKLWGTPAERAMYKRLDQRQDMQDNVLDILADITRG
jgi:SNF2 family DNA or RNA helicase